MKIKTTILALVALLFAFDGVAQVQLPKGRNLNFGLQAHRGLSNQFPENTVLAFREAGKVPCFFGMETDVQMTKDGVLVCMHDSTIDRTTNGTGKVSDAVISQIVADEFDLRPKAIINQFGLTRPIFQATASYGHFGRNEFPWEQLDKVADLKKYL